MLSFSHAFSTVATAFLLWAVCVTAQHPPLNCTEAKSIPFNATQLGGRWSVVARNPALATPKACLDVNLVVSGAGENQTLLLEVSYAHDNQRHHYNSISANVSANATEGSDVGYNISYSGPDANTTSVPTTFKLLDTDYQNYAFVCGFTNSSNNASHFGLVLTRDRVPKENLLNSYEVKAAANFSNFLNGSMPKIAQSDCYKSDAAAPTMPLFWTVMVAIGAFQKLATFLLRSEF